MPKNSVRVSIPTNPADLLALAAKVYQKHVKDGKTSALNALKDYNWTDNGPKIAPALKIQVQITDMEKQLKILYGDRDVLFTPIDATVKKSRNLLLSIYSEHPKKLGDWGFDVNDTKHGGTKPTPPPAKP
jgi:hypothetical protein